MALSRQLEKAIDRAFKALDDVAGPIDFVQITEQYDPITGSLSRTETIYGTTGVLDRYRLDEIEGTIVQTSDSRIYCKPADGYEPETGDLVRVGEIEFTVYESRPVFMYDKPLLWEVRVNR